MSAKKVFISYSHDSDEHRERVLGFSERLRDDGIETLLDRYINGSPAQGWPRWMLDQLDAADSVLVVCTETYYRRFRGHEVPGKGKGGDFEGSLITQEIYDARSRTLKFVPVLFSADDEKFIPEPLRSGTHYTLTSESSYQSLYDFLLEQAGVEPGKVGALKPRTRPRGKPLTFAEELFTQQAKANISRIDKHGAVTDISSVSNSISRLVGGARESRRRIDAAAPSRARLNAKIDVLVQVRMMDSPRLGTEDFPSHHKPDAAAQGSSSASIPFPLDSETGMVLPAQLKVRLVAPDFKIYGSAEAALEVPPDEYSEKLAFLLSPRRQGECRINVELLTVRGEHLRTIPLSTEVNGQDADGGYAVASLVVEVGNHSNTSESMAQSPTRVSRRALRLWQEKLDFLQQQEAVTTDPAQKFAVAQQIKEAKAKIAELAGEPERPIKRTPPVQDSFRTQTDNEAPTRAQPSKRDLVYISYSHQDKPWHQKLRRILDDDPEVCERVWDDTKIPPGADFMKEIDRHVARACVMIMIGSKSYFRPDGGAAQCETRPALAAHLKGEMDILWFPVSEYNYSTSPVGHLMAATGTGAVPLELMPSREQARALHQVHQAVRRSLGLASLDLRKKKPATKSGSPRRRRQKTVDSSTIERVNLKGQSPMQPLVDFVIITPLQEEREAMLAHLGDAKRLPPTNDDIRVYYSTMVPVTFTDGSTGAYKVVLTDLLGMGRLEAANAVGDAIRRWHPKYILLTGIAGGLAKAGVKVGDVLLAEQIADYELQKLTAEKALVRWSVHRADPRLIAAAKQLRPGDWRPLIRESRPEPGESNLHSGPICTGDKVIANGLMDEYRDIWTKLIGVEMEAGGVAGAAFQAANAPGFFMVRGVSDLADADKDHSETYSWRAYACDVAAAFVMAFLKSGPIPANPR